MAALALPRQSGHTLFYSGVGGLLPIRATFEKLRGIAMIEMPGFCQAFLCLLKIGARKTCCPFGVVEEQSFIRLDAFASGSPGYMRE